MQPAWRLDCTRTLTCELRRPKLAKTIVRSWFDIGHQAFKRTFPNVAAQVSAAPFYLCPLCLRFFDEDAIENGQLTREDVPPQSIGGRKLVLTCKPCNSFAGAQMDADMRLEADLISFLSGQGEITEHRAKLKAGRYRIPVGLSAKDKTVQIHARPKAAHPKHGIGIEAAFDRASKGTAWKRFQFHMEFEPYSHARAEASWLRSAYLAFFAALGYRFILRKELDAVRHRIRVPEVAGLRFRVVRREVFPDPSLGTARFPDGRICYAFFFRHYSILLPMYGDSDFYDYTAGQSGAVEFTSDRQFP